VIAQRFLQPDAAAERRRDERDALASSKLREREVG
jgi:hypothetical protein